MNIEITPAAQAIVKHINSEYRRGAAYNTRLWYGADGELLGRAIGPEAWAPGETRYTHTIGGGARPTRKDVAVALLIAEAEAQGDYDRAADIESEAFGA